MANLRPLKAGRSGNPAGRPCAGASLREWLNVMAQWPVRRVRYAASYRRNPAVKRAAAKLLLTACGRGPEAGEAVDRIFDRTCGRVVQQRCGR